MTTSEKKKIPYEIPLIELVAVQSERILNPLSWKGDSTSETTSMEILEEGESGWDGDSRGAKGSLFYESDRKGLWDD